jgi:serine/threonine-protein kinase RsbW
MMIKKLPAQSENLHELLAFITAEAKKNNFLKDIIGKIELVVEEALVNIFKHAYKKSTGDVEVRCSNDDEQTLTIEIHDAGVPFNPLSLAEPDLSTDLDNRQIGGMGVFLIRKMADQVTYRREKDCNILTLTFFNR